MNHVGSLTAQTADEAYESATKLFAWYASDVWVCPASSVARYTTDTLDDDATPVVLESGTEDRTFEG